MKASKLPLRFFLFLFLSFHQALCRVFNYTHQHMHVYIYIYLMLLTYLLTYLLTPWCRVLLKKLTGFQLVKKVPAFHGTRRFITALTSVPSPISILGPPNPVHIPTSHLLEIHPNIIHPSTPRSPQWYIYIYIYMYYLRSLKFTLKYLKRSYMFRSHNHPQGAFTVPC